MNQLNEKLLSCGGLSDIRARLKKGEGPVTVFGLPPVCRALFASAVRSELGAFVAVITPDDQSAAGFAADTSVFYGGEFSLLPTRELTFHNVSGLSREWEQKRISLLHRISASQCPGVCGSFEAFLLRTMPPEVMKENSLTLSLGKEYSLSELSSALERLGYSRAATVEGPGQYAIRGGIFDVFPAGSARPVRTEFFGDEPDSMGYFDTQTQRRTENISSFTLLPASEVLTSSLQGSVLAERLRGLTKSSAKTDTAEKFAASVLADAERFASGGTIAAADRYLPLLYDRMATAFDYLPKNTVILLDDSPRLLSLLESFCRSHTADLKALMEDGVISGRLKGYYLGFDEFISEVKARPSCTLDDFLSSKKNLPPIEIASLICKQLPGYGGNNELLINDLRHYRDGGWKTVLALHSAERMAVMEAVLEENGLSSVPSSNGFELPRSGGITLTVGGISAGMELTDERVVILCEDRRTKRSSVRKTSKKSKNEQIQSFEDLHVGDPVVHDSYGIGRYCGINQMAVDGITRDFVKIAFAGSDVLYLPVEKLDRLSKYLGAGESTSVKLSKLGGAEWTKTRTRAKKAAADLAKKLIELYAKRAGTPGHAFSPDGPWQKEFEDGFEFEETEDQLTASAEIKADMEKPVPMDRLLCGDVGFGKTEVAFRAIMKCILDGKQAAILVPTTVLARQHYISALRRFRNYPIRIAMLSRFVTPSAAADTVRKLRTGGIDLIIGTHKLLSKDVKFSDLGLLVVDEEQRFGVSHKEKLKELTVGTDVLTLSATPIPRTLNMALSGVRDMSLLEESPRDRYPVATYVLEYDRRVVNDAIARELSRGGQVYYLHNRVETIEKAAAKLSADFPDARIIMGHGRMDEAELSEVMRMMTDGEADIFVCTTIIETGIDIPNVNTLIIENADRFGLAQLHQLRGRVGRSSRHASAYLTYKPDSVLTEISAKRLAAMRDFAEFGAGFKIAMRDLEIRGAGNILGAEQSGHMLSVGYDMYLRLIEEAVAELKGEKPPVSEECTVDLRVPAIIPEDYVTSGVERMDLYRRMAKISSEEDVSDMTDELCDRFGDCPEETLNLLNISLLRSRAAQLGITEISDKNGPIAIYLPNADLKRIGELCGMQKYRGRLLFGAGERPHLALRLGKNDDRLQAALELFEDYTAKEDLA